ncbi:MAG: AI-2E family transporter [Chitinophagales bacterium]
MTSLSNIFGHILGGIGDIILGIFAVVFISFFFLKDEKLFYSIIMGITPTQFEEKTKRILTSSKKTLTRYFAGIILQSTIVFVLVAVSFWIAGYNYALLIGFFCAIINIIPYLGPIIGSLFALLVTVTTQFAQDPEADFTATIITVVFIVQGVQLIDNYISQPYIFSNRMNAHPLEIFFIVLVFGTLAGIPGMIIAVPVYSFLRIIAREFFSEFKIVRNITQGIDKL